MKKNVILVIVLTMISIFFLGYVGFTGYAAFKESSQNEKIYSCPDCNVILISIDTLRADHLGVYGYYRDTTPNLDKFAQEAIVFDKAYAQAPITLPSHMSMLTSLYPSKHGLIANNFSLRLKNSTLTLADMLRKKGYKTGAFTAGGYVSNKYNYHGFDVFDSRGGSYWNNFNRMLNWVDKNSDKKFFLFFHTSKTHSPYATVKKYDIFSDKNYSGLINPYPLKDDPICMRIKDTRRRETCFKSKGWIYYQYKILIDNLTEEDLDYIKAKYDGEILEMDYRFGELLEFLREKGLLDKTIIIFTSDHGESFAERRNSKYLTKWKRFKIGHAILYEEVLRVPLVIKIPGYNEQVRFDSIVELVDIMPTVLEILGIESPEKIDGENLFSKINDKNQENFAFSEITRDHNFSIVSYALAYKEYRMIFRKVDNSFELYNLKKDSFQRNNIYDQGLLIGEAMKEMLFSQIVENVVEAETSKVDEETLEQLRALGYI